MKTLVFTTAILLASSSALAQSPSEMKPMKTKIQSSFKDDRIVINNDFVGLGYVVADVSDYVDVVYDAYNTQRAKEHFAIMAMPGSRGTCTHSIAIFKGDRIPKAIALDTRLCPAGKDINIYSN